MGWACGDFLCGRNGRGLRHHDLSPRAFGKGTLDGAVGQCPGVDSVRRHADFKYAVGFLVMAVRAEGMKVI